VTLLMAHNCHKHDKYGRALTGKHDSCGPDYVLGVPFGVLPFDNFGDGCDVPQSCREIIDFLVHKQNLQPCLDEITAPFEIYSRNILDEDDNVGRGVWFHKTFRSSREYMHHQMEYRTALHYDVRGEIIDVDDDLQQLYPMISHTSITNISETVGLEVRSWTDPFDKPRPVVHEGFLYDADNPFQHTASVLSGLYNTFREEETDERFPKADTLTWRSDCKFIKDACNLRRRTQGTTRGVRNINEDNKLLYIRMLYGRDKDEPIGSVKLKS